MIMMFLLERRSRLQVLSASRQVGWIDGGIGWKFGLLILGENVGIGNTQMECQDRFIGLERGVWVSGG